MEETDVTESDREIKRLKYSKMLGVPKLSKRISSKDNASPLPVAPVTYLSHTTATVSRSASFQPLTGF